VVIGAQSGRDRLLDRPHRGHTAADVVSAVAAIHKAGLKANVDFIFGLPDETDVDLEATFPLIDRLVEMGARIRAHTFMPLPQTPLADVSPAALRPAAIRQLNHLIALGQAYGQWLHQEKKARAVAQRATKSDGTVSVR